MIQTIKQNKLLLIILLGIFFNELLFAMVTPLWQNNDEIEHFAYTYYIIEEQKIPITTGGGQLDLTTSDELAKANKILMSDEISFGVFERRQLIHQNFNQTLSNDELEDTLEPLTRLDSSQNYKNATANYPPLYYLIEAIPYKIFQNQSIIHRAYAMRIFGILFMLITVFFSFKIAQNFFQKNKIIPYVVAILIGFLPRFVFTSAGINNDAIIIAISTITIYLLLKYLDRSLTTYSSLLMGFIFGIGLLSKPQFMIFFLFLIIFYIYKLVKEKNIKQVFTSIIIVTVIILLVSGSWLWFNYINRSITPVSQISSLLHLVPDQGGLINNLSITTKYVILRYLFLITSYFSLLGCCHEISIAPIFLGWFLMTAGLGIFGLILYIKDVKKFFKINNKLLWLISFPIVLELSYLVIYLRQPLMTGTVDFPIDGRYLFPVISSLTIIMIIGLTKIIPKKLHQILLLTLVSGIIFINIYTLFFQIIPRYYL